MAGKKAGQLKKAETMKDLKLLQKQKRMGKDNAHWQAQVAQEANLKELMDWCEKHPEATSAMLCQVRSGSWDSGSENESEAEEKLPPYQNKVHLLSRDNVVKLVSGFLPSMGAFIESLPKKTPKADLGSILAYLTNMDPASALPTKKVGPLRDYFRDRWVRNGERCKDWLFDSDGDATTQA